MKLTYSTEPPPPPPTEEELVALDLAEDEPFWEKAAPEEDSE